MRYTFTAMFITSSFFPWSFDDSTTFFWRKYWYSTSFFPFLIQYLLVLFLKFWLPFFGKPLFLSFSGTHVIGYFYNLHSSTGCCTLLLLTTSPGFVFSSSSAPFMTSPHFRTQSWLLHQLRPTDSPSAPKRFPPLATPHPLLITWTRS